MPFLRSETTFKPGGSFPWEFTPENLSQRFVLRGPSLTHKGDRYSIFCIAPLLALLAYIESATTHLTLTFISFCCMRIQSFRRMNTLKEMCSMNEIPPICILLIFASNSTAFFSLPLTMGCNNGGRCWQCSRRSSGPQTSPFPVQRLSWLWKVVSDNPVCIWVWPRTPYGCHPSVWGTFPGVWLCGAEDPWSLPFPLLTVGQISCQDIRVFVTQTSYAEVSALHAEYRYSHSILFQKSFMSVRKRIWLS